ncbi:MAG: NAD-dependent epimerase/dehydratase family protein [Spirochaetia bacterium]|nr:NAD-dependent epimerase/dehydratase family protein [Spirochaetia bacterium]
MRKILIIGKTSFIGVSLNKWLSLKYDTYCVTLIGAKNSEWRKIDLSKYEVVINVAGIAHIKAKKSLKSLFYYVNRDLAIEIGCSAKIAGVKQYIYFSSMNVYGDFVGKITSDTIPAPYSFYGESKLQADKKLLSICSDNFRVLCIRPPVVYGKGCKGNFLKLLRYSRFLRIVPDYHNYKSVIHIDNLCECIRLLIDKNYYGIIHPQNKDIISTKEMIMQIRSISNKKTYQIKIFNPIIKKLVKYSHAGRRIFGDDYYDTNLSTIPGIEYSIHNFTSSLKNIF